MSTNNSSVNAEPTPGASLGNKVKGAFQAAHGMGESIRGNAMDALDTSFGTRSAGAVNTQKKGSAEVSTGVTNMEGGAAGAGADPAAGSRFGSGAGTRNTTAGTAVTGTGTSITGANTGASAGAGTASGALPQA
ncbi:hypothetical protein JAAARDRAFT_59902 [Jaapia argillacea MUCL 33604]|uniref:Uncharacterized protein n=1 Tax=Jaapia argillacea MUCL 33604 TaxID=933084 RepID=A0A067PNK6_9AGAM|nr:hypothetical protein JAAARDRAFT_59902 [Jaapia argillacea MUCL 33604]